MVQASSLPLMPPVSATFLKSFKTANLDAANNSTSYTVVLCPVGSPHGSSWRSETRRRTCKRSRNDHGSSISLRLTAFLIWEDSIQVSAKRRSIRELP